MADFELPLKPIFNYNVNEVVELLVGEGEAQQAIIVHKDYISSSSEFFRAALNKQWQEGQTQVIRLPEDDPDTVAQYLDFIYHKLLPTHRKTTIVDYDTMYFALARLYVYGERVLDDSIRNNIINHFISWTVILNRDNSEHLCYPGPDAVGIIYSGTTATSPARRLMVDIYARCGRQEWLVPELHPSFLQDVARSLMIRDPEHRKLPIWAKDYYVS